MRLSLNWLSEWIDHGLSVEELADKLTMSGSEVKQIEHVGGYFEQVLVGEIVELHPHPDADRLRLPKIRIGEHDIRQVVCGAPNLEVGQKIAFAQEGAMLYMDPESGERSELMSATIRGVESRGMVCSERELGLGTQHKKGILVLPADAPVGQDLGRFLGLKDTIFDLEITPNRGDCLSVLGIAREVAAITGEPLKIDPDQAMAEAEAWAMALPKPEDFSLELRDTTLCPAYSVLLAEGVQATRSEILVRWRLTHAGVRPINALVDATNYVMLELGEPQHAFDRARLRGGIVVRRAEAGELLTTLDSQERTLTDSMLVIADQSQGVAVAGIMGGEETEIGEQTTRLALEAAHFDPVNIRKTSTALGLRSEASGRWEKFVYPRLRVWSLKRALDLLIGQGQTPSNLRFLDENTWQEPMHTIELKSSKLSQLLGKVPEPAVVADKLTSLGFEVQSSEESAEPWSLQVKVPGFRPDVREAADLVEEVIRLLGYDWLGMRLPEAEFPLASTHYTPSPRRELVNLLMGQGYTEAYRYAMVKQALLDKLDWPPSERLVLSNPLADFEVMRPSLLPTLLDTLATNQVLKRSLKLFEIGRVFQADQEANGLPAQPLRFGAVCYHTDAPSDREGPWQPSEQHLADLKQLLQAIGSRWLNQKLTLHPLDDQLSFSHLFHPGRQARIELEGETIGVLSEIHPQYLKPLGLEQGRVGYLDLDLEPLERRLTEQRLQHQKAFSAYSSYPEAEMDLSFVVSRQVSSADFEEAIWRANIPHFKSARLLDQYHDDELDQQQLQALTWRVSFGSDETTLDDASVNQSAAQLIKLVETTFDATLRGTLS